MNYIKRIKPFIGTASAFLLKHIVIIFVIIVVGIFSVLTFEINQLSNAEPTADQIAEKNRSILVVKIDDNLVAKIKELHDSNVFVAPDYNSLDTNPFYRKQ